MWKTKKKKTVKRFCRRLKAFRFYLKRNGAKIVRVFSVKTTHWQHKHRIIELRRREMKSSLYMCVFARACEKRWQIVFAMCRLWSFQLEETKTKNVNDDTITVPAEIVFYFVSVNSIFDSKSIQKQNAIETNGNRLIYLFSPFYVQSQNGARLNVDGRPININAINAIDVYRQSKWWNWKKWQRRQWMMWNEQTNQVSSATAAGHKSEKY